MQEISLEIIQKAAEGDIDAFERIYRAASGFVYTLALGIVRRPEEAAEVTQDVFMKVYRSLKNFRNESSLRTWIYRIAVNTSLNARKRKAVTGQRETTFDENVHVPETVPDGTHGRGELARYLLSQLTPDHRAVLLLREMEGLSYQEIAEVLQININTVRTRIIRARRALLALAGNEVIRHEM